MSVISRQFAKDILLSTIFVLIVLIALFAFFDLIGQLDDLGADYTIGRAFLTTSLTLPSRAYEVMPLAVLLASVYIRCQSGHPLQNSLFFAHPDALRGALHGPCLFRGLFACWRHTD